MRSLLSIEVSCHRLMLRLKLGNEIVTQHWGCHRLTQAKKYITAAVNCTVWRIIENYSFVWRLLFDMFVILQNSNNYNKSDFVIFMLWYCCCCCLSSACLAVQGRSPSIVINCFIPWGTEAIPRLHCTIPHGSEQKERWGRLGPTLSGVGALPSRRSLGCCHTVVLCAVLNHFFTTFNKVILLNVGSCWLTIAILPQ